MSTFGRYGDLTGFYDEIFFYDLENYLMGMPGPPTMENCGFFAAQFIQDYHKDQQLELYGQAPYTGADNFSHMEHRSFSVSSLRPRPREFDSPGHMARYDQVCRNVMQRHAKEATPEQNVRAFLRLIRYAEHDGKDDSSVYHTLYGGGKFTDDKTHPLPKGHEITKWGHRSSAAGAYQILYGTWKEQKDKGLVNDFSPDAQDKIARYKLDEKGARTLIEEGDVEGAMTKLRHEWTSLPGATQSKMTMQQAHVLFTDFVIEEMYLKEKK